MKFGSWCENCTEKDSTTCNPQKEYPTCYKPKDSIPASAYIGH